MPSKKRPIDIAAEPFTIPVRQQLQRPSIAIKDDAAPVEHPLVANHMRVIEPRADFVAESSAKPKPRAKKVLVPVIDEPDEPIETPVEDAPAIDPPAGPVETAEPEVEATEDTKPDPEPEPDPEPQPEPDTKPQTPRRPQKKPAVPSVDAAEVDERARRIQEYIDNRKYYVPINAVARRRSIKVSWLLTLVIILLAIALIDLMLDSGLIILLQQIPHTHFFNLSPN